MRALLTAGAALVAAALLCSGAAIADAPKSDTPKISHPQRVRPQSAGSVYDNQAEFTEAELLKLCRDLPEFRAWVKTSGEKPHPSVRKGKADFTYSEQAADWARFRGWDDRRFFCVMGRSAAAFAQLTDGAKQSQYRDMPTLTRKELDLVELHMGEIMKAFSGESKAAPSLRGKKQPDK